jgi:NADH-quinone oxidoreductase subunit J
MQRALVFTLAIGLACFLALGVFTARPVAAQPAPGQPIQLHVQNAPAPTMLVQHAERSTHGDVVDGDGTGMALLFWAFAAASIGGALFVISRRNLIAAVMGMVGSFLGIAAVYMMLFAHFLAVIQMLVYAGAIMVLFVFVIMILNRPEDEPVAPTGHLGQAIGGLAILYLIGRLVMLLAHVTARGGSDAAPQPVVLPGGEIAPWGSVKAVGTDLFSGGLFPFEAISILLLIAVVGAIAIAKPLKDDDGEATDAPDAGEPALAPVAAKGGHS